MKMMKRLLDKLGRAWNKVPKSINTLSIQKAAGTHSLITINNGVLTLHSTLFYPDMPVKQTIILDGFSVGELTSQLITMGYTANITSEAIEKNLHTQKATVLLDVYNIPISTLYTCMAFTSELWQTLYPIARILEENSMNVDAAIRQMLSTSSEGVWTDYWATFFNLQRLAGEQDASFQKRLFLAITNLKTNNVAIQQMIRYALSSDAIVEDVEPALFRVTVEAEFMTSASSIHQIILELKGAGIDYFLNYAKANTEDYKAYFRDRYSQTFNSSDSASIGIMLSTSEDYSQLEASEIGTIGFILNTSELVGTARLNVADERLKDSGSMTFTRDGVVIQSTTFE